MVHLLILSILSVLGILDLGCGGVSAAAIKPATTSTDYPLIEWPEGCSQYSEPVSERRPSPRYIHHQTSSSESSCRSLCTSRQDCGGFVMLGSTTCQLYNINDDVITDHFNDNWFSSSSSYTWHSKSCRPYSVGVSDMSCNEYKDKYEENQYISSVWRIMYTWPGSILNLSPGQCQAWCTLYPGCRSVVYERHISNGHGVCNLYMTTIGELLGSGHSGDVLQWTGSWYTYTTYDRYCPDTDLPYIPGNKVVCGGTGADVTLHLPPDMLTGSDDVILYVADQTQPVYYECTFKFSSEEVIESQGALNIHVDYARCGGVLDDDHLVLNSSVVAALQHSHSSQMFAIYHLYCQLSSITEALSTQDFNIPSLAKSVKQVISETVIDDVITNTDVTFIMELMNDVIQAHSELTLTITSDPSVPFTVQDCSMVSTLHDEIRVTIIGEDGCMSNGAISNVTDAGIDIHFPLVMIPFINHVYFTCHVTTCIIHCPQNECGGGVGVVTSHQDNEPPMINPDITGDVKGKRITTNPVKIR